MTESKEKNPIVQISFNRAVCWNCGKVSKIMKTMDKDGVFTDQCMRCRAKRVRQP